MNLPELIERLNTPGDEVFSTRQKEVIAKAIEQLAAALAAKDEAISRHIKVDEFLTNCPSDVSEDEHIAALEEHYNSLANMHKVAAIQPHAELVAKIKADAVELFLAEKQVTYGTLLIADRIKRGEVK